ncbi:unnamed protein product [Acanthosepion pharaonis]|uniref:Uncharacterized protein n=1 Tax=Acanthosepion pharaonis TaxID=158019 RepID=A0A812AWK9_ACAPH|nr:unnamed protein product [Sepia pharaonis]
MLLVIKSSFSQMRKKFSLSGCSYKADVQSEGDEYTDIVSETLKLATKENVVTVIADDTVIVVLLLFHFSLDMAYIYMSFEGKTSREKDEKPAQHPAPFLYVLVFVPYFFLRCSILFFFSFFTRKHSSSSFLRLPQLHHPTVFVLLLLLVLLLLHHHHPHHHHHHHHHHLLLHLILLHIVISSTYNSFFLSVSFSHFSSSSSSSPAPLILLHLVTSSSYNCIFLTASPVNFPHVIFFFFITSISSFPFVTPSS